MMGYLKELIKDMQLQVDAAHRERDAWEHTCNVLTRLLSEARDREAKLAGDYCQDDPAGRHNWECRNCGDVG